MSDDEPARVAEAARLMRANAALFQQMGHLASDWAMLEYFINECIWKLAGMAPAVGACVTSQIFTVNNRLAAVIALMYRRGFSPADIRQVNRFANEVRGLAEKRNRAIHDPIFVHPGEGKAGRLEVTAQGRPVFDIVPVTPEELKAIRKEIWATTEKFLEIRQGILDTLPTLPQLPNAEHVPVNMMFVTPPREGAE